jgi:hypothetical protein
MNNWIWFALLCILTAFFWFPTWKYEHDKVVRQHVEMERMRDALRHAIDTIAHCKTQQ